MELTTHIKEILGDSYNPSLKYVACKPSGVQRKLRQGFTKACEDTIFNNEPFVIMVKEASDASTS